MKILTSYFYQIRNFKHNMIPLSTAVSDPKWFHNYKSQTYQFKDNNGVYNGLKAEPFVPKMTWGDCCGPKNCKYKPVNCKFLSQYYEQLKQLNFSEMIERFEKLSNKIKDYEGFEEEPVMILIFYEPPDNPCSERRIVQKWFKENGYDIEEY